MLWVSLCFGFMPTHGLSNLLFLKHFNAVLIQTLFSRLVINECTRLVSLDIANPSFIDFFVRAVSLNQPIQKNHWAPTFCSAYWTVNPTLLPPFYSVVLSFWVPCLFLHSPTQPFNDRLCCSFRSWWSLTAVTGSSAIGSGFTPCSKCSAWSRRWSGANGSTPRTRLLL